MKKEEKSIYDAERYQKKKTRKKNKERKRVSRARQLENANIAAQNADVLAIADGIAAATNANIVANGNDELALKLNGLVNGIRQTTREIHQQMVDGTLELQKGMAKQIVSGIQELCTPMKPAPP